MNLEELADRIGAALRQRPDAPSREIHRVYAANRMSDLLNGAAPETLLITSLTSPQLFRMADIMDVPGVCVVKGARARRAQVDAAVRRGIAVLLSPWGLRETCDRTNHVLAAVGPDGDMRKARRDRREGRRGVCEGR